MPQATTNARQAPRPSAQGGPATAPRANPSTPLAVPVTQSDVDALLARRSELGAQLSSANDRRNALSRQLRNAKAGPDQAGIEARITQLDGQIISIGSDMADVGHAIAAAPTGLLHATSTGVPIHSGGLNAGQVTAISIIGMFTVLMPLAIALGKLLLRRGVRPPAPQIPKDVSDRLERMEQGIETVAVEVERIGEGQRFVTQLLSDRAQRAALPESIPRT